MGMVVMSLRDCRPDGCPRVVKELVLQTRGHMSDCITVVFSKVSSRGKESGELALANLIGVVA